MNSTPLDQSLQTLHFSLREAEHKPDVMSSVILKCTVMEAKRQRITYSKNALFKLNNGRVK